MTTLKNQVQRLASVLHCIQILDRPTAEAIAKELNCSDRTARNWINQLRELGAPIPKLEGGHDGYSIEREWSLGEALKTITDGAFNNIDEDGDHRIW